ncbi:MAG TPA: sigma-70 family RNA polymerase sigma factor, partial [Opitutaceae bacterium]|nr:sigma-70 family RNA polymerase sigma factor [Opitutaceae bacterium]
RAWLCGIARNLIRNAQRRAGRDPARLAETLEAAPEVAAVEPLPTDQAISHEEEAILWHSLALIPEAYREPLVLYYREHHSVARVAEALELSEDAVKQRLSRGRVLLQEQVLALVEGTLERSNPGRAFTVGVLAALPVLGTAAKTVAVGAAAGQGSTSAKTAVATAGGITFFGLVTTFVGLLGGLTGYRMSDGAQSREEQLWAGRFWRWIAFGLGAFVLPSFVLAIFWHRRHPELLPFAAWWLGLFYAVLAVPLVLWAWRNHRRLRRGEGTAASPESVPPRFRTLWIALVTICAAGLIVFGVFDTNWRVRRLSMREAQELIAAHPNVNCHVSQYLSGSRYLWIVLSDGGRKLKFTAPADAATLALLADKGIRCPTYLQGRDFEILGWPGRFLFLAATFAFAAGAAALVRIALRRSRATSSR